MFKDFTIDGYRELLEIALQNNFSFVDFNNFFLLKENGASIGKICILRHDIDTDLDAALQLAIIENSLGIKSTYFLMFRSPVYNLLSRINFSLVNKILELGHKIGLHYDANYLFNPEDIEEKVKTELNCLNQLFNINSNVVSFHQPDSFILENKINFSGIINTYDKIQFKDVVYFSDSNKKWRLEDPLKIFNSNEYVNVQLLIHPMWWAWSENFSTREIWIKTLKKNFNNNIKQVVESEGAFGDSVTIEIY